MRILFETKNGKKYTWKPTAWQKAAGYVLTGLLIALDVYLVLIYGHMNNIL